MIKEEYSFSHIEDYLYDNIDLLIAGFSSEEERSVFFSELWKSKNKDILYLALENNEIVAIKLISNNIVRIEQRCDLCVGLPRLLKNIGVSDKNILLDMSSLDNVLIMFLTKQLLSKVTPKSLFASYIRPEK